ncbi:MAG: helix-turn-helix transcriptional regulator, partial [Lachnospiraceae bacterium]|nr:helix-turn-helix transcriptional regulator [Lachnospiraceae bacterium]
FNNISQTKQHEYINKFLNVCNYINDHYAEDIDADTLASIAGFSRFHFSRLFKQYTGSTYYEYLTKKRIEMAERYLISPELSITEVAMRSGFNSLSTFNRVFKSALGCTPSEYKGLNRGF